MDCDKCFEHELLQMVVAVKKILYSADENDTALAEAQQIVSQSIINHQEIDFE